MKTERILTMQEELDILMIKQIKVQLHITENFNPVGHVLEVAQDYIRFQDVMHEGKNKYVVIPINNIVYVREIKE